MVPYTYLIGWSTHDKWYYGVRYANDCHPDDLWVKYKTSSKYVGDFFTLHGDPDIVEVRQTFLTKEAAKKWEDTVLRRLGVVCNVKWLNKANNNAFKGIVFDDDIRARHKIGINKSRVKRKTINDGVSHRIIPIEEEVPEGWVLGLTKKRHSDSSHHAKHLWDNKTEEERSAAAKKVGDKTRGVPKPPGHGEAISKATKGVPKPWQAGDRNVSKRVDVREKISLSWETREIGKWYTNEDENFYIKDGDNIDPSWRRGKMKQTGEWYTDEKNKFYVEYPNLPDPSWRKGYPLRGVWYTNGDRSKCFTKNEVIPDGWVLGRWFSEQGALNIKVANSKPKSEEHKRNLSKAKTKKNV